MTQAAPKQQVYQKPIILAYKVLNHSIYFEYLNTKGDPKGKSVGYTKMYNYALQDGCMSWYEDKMIQGETEQTHLSITYAELLEDTEMFEGLLFRYLTKES